MSNNESPKIRSYGGNEPYIFVSYAHKDTETVSAAIKAMQELGYRVWFDLGIEVGTEWSNNIASHLRDCSAFVAFLSHNSVKSENCLDEIAYAKSNKKPSLMIFLEEDVTLPEGTDMQTARFQRMFLNRQESMEAFKTNIADAPILEPCRGEVETGGEISEEKPAPKTADTKKPEKSSGKSGNNGKKTAVIGAAAGIIIVALIIALVISLGGGKDDGVKEPSQSTENTQTDGTEDTPVTMSDSLLDYTFKLDGEVYKLPFAFTLLTENGWTITSSGYSSDYLVGGMDKESFTMVKDGHRISVGIYNQSGNAKTIAECTVGEISVDANNNVDFEIAKGIKPGATADEVVAAFGTPGERNSYDGYEKLTYGQNSYGVDGVTFYCYTGEDQFKYSSIELAQYVSTSNEITETDETVPEYLAEYVAPESMGDSIISGVVKIGGDLYQMPVPVQKFIDNGWIISGGPGSIVAGGTDYISLSRDGAKIDVSVANGAEYQTIPQNCVVYSVTVYRDDQTEMELPGGVKLGITEEELKSLVPDTFETNENTYTNTYSYYEYSPRDFSIYISVDNEDGVVDYIKVKNSSWGVSAE